MQLINTDELSKESYKVYWIHLPEHTDRFSQGYIGITKRLKQRWLAHKKTNSKRNCPLIAKAIAKYGDTLVWEVIFEDVPQTLAMFIEYTYRPSDQIGWNIKQGGYCPKIPQTTKDKISKAHKGKVLTQEHKDNISKNSCMANNPDAKARMIATQKALPPFSAEHRANISKSLTGKAQPNLAGAKNGRFRPWYMVTPEGERLEFTNTSTREYEELHNLKEGEIRSKLKTANKGKVYQMGKYKGYLFDHI